MRRRFVKVFVFVAVLAGVFAGVALALDFDEDDIPPPKTEVGAVYHFEITGTGGCLPYHFAVDSGTVPPGTKLSDLDYQTGLVSGVPTQSGTFSAWLSIHSCEGRSAQDLFTFEVAPRTWGIKTTSLPPAAVGALYSTKLAAGDHPTTSVKWEVTSGALPAGLTLASDGTISGTPAAAGSSTFTITATSTASDGVTRVDSKQFTLSVVSLTATASRTVAEVGLPFRSALVASGGQAPYTWSLSGLAPPGLSVTPDGTITGIPTRAGSFTLTAHVVDASGAARDLQVKLLVRARVTVATTRLPAAANGHAYRAKIAVRGGESPFRWSLVRGTLPRGLKLAASGTISGKPASSGAFRISVRVRDGLSAIATKTLVLTVR